MKAKHTQILFPCMGALVAYLVFHPYTMLVSFVMHLHQGGDIHLHWNNLFSIAVSSFKPMMFPMAIGFAVFGGVIGLLIGILFDKKEKLILSEHENEKKRVALETLENLMVTLSHYLLNANVVIGGKARHCRKLESNKDTLASLKVIEEQAKKIDAVVTALKKVTEIKTAKYTTEGHELLIDITREIEEELSKIKEKENLKEPEKSFEGEMDD